MSRKKKGKREKDGEILEEQEDFLLSQETKNSIFSVLFFLGAVLLSLSLFNKAGVAGEWIKRGLEFLFGQASFLLPLFFFLGSVAFLVHVKRRHWSLVLAGGILFLVSILGIIELLQLQGAESGLVGYFIVLPILAFLSKTAGLFLLAAFFLVGLLVMFDISLGTIMSFFYRKPLPEDEQGTEPIEQSEWQATPLQRLKRTQQRIQEFTEGKKEKGDTREQESIEARDDAYQPPPLSLLEPDGAGPSSGNINANKNIIQKTLDEFGIEAEMGDVSVGPTVTQYTLRPSQGVNLTRITALSRNLSLALAAHPIRIEAPIPGKSLVGIEIPNKQSSVVRLRPLLKNIVNKKMASTLTSVIGRDVAGEPVMAFLESMPHLLISGSTGAGKSIALNAILTTFLYLNSPRTLKLLLIDPKRVEFSTYEGIPHLLTPVIVDSQKAISALKWTVSEMENRYELLQQANARDINGYNKSISRDPHAKTMPYLVVIIDEMADLMMKYKREVEGAIVRIAQMARAVGIHLITATQRPSTNVVTGLIKANIPSRMAFKVPTQIDSRTILDQAGAEKLLGKGDMLFMSGESHGLKRIQGVYISEKEVKKVVAHLKNLEWEDDYESSIEGQKEEAINILGSGFGGDDELYEDARIIAQEAGKISASLLQRKLQIGYARAARLLDMMEEQGIIGPAQGSKPREVIK